MRKPKPEPAPIGRMDSALHDAKNNSRVFIFSIGNEGNKHSPPDAKIKSGVFVCIVGNEGRKHSPPHDAKNKSRMFV